MENKRKIEMYELELNEYKIEKIYKDTEGKCYAVYLVDGTRWQFPLSVGLYLEILKEFGKDMK